MIKIFKSRGGAGAPPPSRALENLKRGIEAIKKALAFKLSRFFESRSRPFKWGFLVIFCLLFGGLSIQAVYSGFTGRKALGSIGQVPPPSIPWHLGKGIETPTHSPGPISEELYQHVIEVDSYLDSLEKTDRESYDRIILERPRLRDSLAMIRQLYLSHKN